MSKATAQDQLFQSIRELIQSAKQHVVRNVNTTMLFTYFEIGKIIVVNEQEGKQRADYAKMIIDKLSKDLTREFGKGYSTTNLEYFRRFYLLYQNRISQSVIGKSQNKSSTKKHASISRSLIGKSEYPFSLSWTHYIQLLKIEDKKERDFYEIEAAQNNWSVRELMRQFNATCSAGHLT